MLRFLLFALFCSAWALPPADERNALCAIKDAIPALHGIWSGCGGSTPCGMKGVKCDFFQLYVTEIILGKTEYTKSWSNWPGPLVGTIPAAAISVFQRLTKLYINGGPRCEGNISQWTMRFGNRNAILDLSGNNFVGAVPAYYGDLQLNAVYLNNNKLTGTIPANIFNGGGGRPEIIHLHSNLLTGTIPNNVNANPGFSEFCVDDNRLTGTIPANFRNCNNLNYLSLAKNGFTGTMPTFFRNMNLLEFLSLSDNQLTGTVPAGYAFQKDMKYIFMSGNNLTGDLSIYFNGPENILDWGALIPPLRFMDFSYNRFNRGSFENGGWITQRDVVIFDPQEVDECALGTHTCDRINGYCADGWYPRGSFTCACNRGFSMNATFGCTDIQECTSGLAGSLGSYQLNPTVACTGEASNCVNAVPGYYCCPRGYENPAIERDGTVANCIDIDECARGDWNNPNATGTRCVSQQACINTPGSFYCCPRGYETTPESPTVCRDIDECARGLYSSLSGLNGTTCPDVRSCINTPGSFFCCASGYEAVRKANGTAASCRDLDECVLGTWNSLNGLNGTKCVSKAACINTMGSFYCCASGFQRRNLTSESCDDIDECAAQLGSQGGHNCSREGTCINTLGSYFCCPQGFKAGVGNFSGLCVDYDECVLGKVTDGHNCALNELCINTNGSFICCPPGFRAGVGNFNGTCVDIDECSEQLSPFQTSSNNRSCYIASCVNSNGSFSCCDPGYQTNANRTHCEDIDECNSGLWSSNTSCVTQLKCVNTNGSFYCCPPGYKRSEDGTQCEDVDECLSDLYSSSELSLNGTGCSFSSCMNVPGGFYCCGLGHRRNLNGTECEDIDECALGLSVTRIGLNGTSCPHDSCINTPGNFSCCADGYESKFGNVCTDIDECSSGYPFDIGCSKVRCLNKPGTYECCAEGSIANGSQCIDFNDCSGTTTCAPYRCVNNITGTYSCCEDEKLANANNTECAGFNECTASKAQLVGALRCSSSFLCEDYDFGYGCCNQGFWNPTPDEPGARCVPCGTEFVEAAAIYEPGKNNYFYSLAPYYANSQNQFNHSRCYGACEQGFRFYSRYVPRDSCPQTPTDRRDICSFACKNLTLYDTARTAIRNLNIEFQRGNFLIDVFHVIFGVEVTFPTDSLKRAGTEALSFTLTPCPPKQQVNDLITDLSEEIVPGVPPLSLSIVDALNGGSCEVGVSATDSDSKTMIGIIIGVIVGLICLFLLILLAYLIYSRILRGLPEEVAWSYQAYLTNPIGWTYRGTKQSGYYFKDLRRGSSMYARAAYLWESLRGANKGNHQLIVEKITAVYNPTLVTNFIGQYKIMLTRSGNELFQRKNWTKSKEADQKTWVNNNYDKYVSQFPWNDKEKCPPGARILPVLHGTDAQIAEKICETGFAALSSLDAGYFGKGIYFTSFALYALPYISSKHSPAIIVSYVLPGNVYPVTEGHKGPTKLLGGPIKNGYSSHYVCTNRMGDCLEDPSSEFYDEFVIPQESQITPAFIFHIGPANFMDLAQYWQRDLAPMEIVKPQISKHSAAEEDFISRISLDEASEIV